MNDLISLQFNGADIRVFTEDGKPWWVAKDVCAVLGYASAGDNVTQIIQRLDDDEKRQISIPSNNNPVANFQRPVWCVSEPGLYSLILWSKVPAAQSFKRWVTHEVLPQIRRTGAYAPDIPKTYPDALRAYAAEIEHREAVQADLEAARPKIEFFDTVASSKTAIPMSQAAKVLDAGVGRNRLFAFLREAHVLQANNEPYQEYIDRGWFRVVEQGYTRNDGSRHINIKTLVYQRGLDGIRRLLVKEGAA